MKAIGESSNASVRLSRGAFTLVEMLVVISIILLLTAVTIASVNFSISGDRVRSSARQIQSLLAGARDRAIYSKEIRGVRLLRDPNDSHAVNAIQYVGAPGKLSDGTLSVSSFPGNDGSVLDGVGTQFDQLRKRGLIRVGSRIQIPKNTGSWYTISNFSYGTEQISLSRKYAEFVDPTIPSTSSFGRTYTDITYQVELVAQPLADSAPVPLARGIVIDLDGSNIPPSWRPISFAGAYPSRMDILFSARGTIIGEATSLGMVHLHVADAGDVVKWKTIQGRSATTYAREPLVPADMPGSPGTIVVTKDQIVVTLTTRTGNVSVHPVNTINTASLPASRTGSTIDQTQLADDPFKFAETGEVASK